MSGATSGAEPPADLQPGVLPAAAGRRLDDGQPGASWRACCAFCDGRASGRWSTRCWPLAEAARRVRAAGQGGLVRQAGAHDVMSADASHPPRAAAPHAPRACAADAAVDPRQVKASWTRVLQGLSSPVAMTHPPRDSRLFVVERTGQDPRVVRNGALKATPFLDLTGRVNTSGEGGLLGLAFKPNYRTSGHFFVLYTDANMTIKVRRYRNPTPSGDVARRDRRRRPLDPAPRQREPLRRQARVRPGRLPVRQHGRRRRDRRPERQRAEPRTPCSARSCASTSATTPARRRGRTRCRRPTRTTAPTSRDAARFG